AERRISVQADTPRSGTMYPNKLKQNKQKSDSLKKSNTQAAASTSKSGQGTKKVSEKMVTMPADSAKNATPEMVTMPAGQAESGPRKPVFHPGLGVEGVIPPPPNHLGAEIT
ncbi:hypothetical protein ACLKA7_007597, partial [Drosophila subpalustris]